MDIEYLSDFVFAKELTLDSMIECPYCNQNSPARDWDYAGYWCELCEDDHKGIECPKCLNAVDSVYQYEKLKTT